MIECILWSLVHTFETLLEEGEGHIVQDWHLEFEINLSALLITQFFIFSFEIDATECLYICVDRFIHLLLLKQFICLLLLFSYPFETIFV